MRKLKEKLVCECGQLTINNKCLECDNSQEYHQFKLCPKCTGKLELTRYFACKSCQSELPDDPGEFIYNVENY